MLITKNKSTTGHPRLPIRSRLKKRLGSTLSTIRYHNCLYDKSLELTREVMAYPLLKAAWTRTDGSEDKAFRVLFNHNLYFFLEKDCFSDDNIITPEGTGLYLADAFIDDNHLMLPYMLDDPADLPFPSILYIFFCFKDWNVPVYSFTEYVEVPDFDDGHCPVLKVPKTILKALETDPHPMVYIALSSPSPSFEKDFWTCTSAVRFNISAIADHYEDENYNGVISVQNK